MGVEVETFLMTTTLQSASPFTMGEMSAVYQFKKWDLVRGKLDELGNGFKLAMLHRMKSGRHLDCQ